MKLSVLLSVFCSTILSFSVPTKQLVRFVLIAMESVSFKGIAGDRAPMRFVRFWISSFQIFYTSPTHLTMGIVNLHPIIPGHVLIVPWQVAPLPSDLTEEEYQYLWGSVWEIKGTFQSQYYSRGFNIAVQNGPAAGLSVLHINVHILPINDVNLD